MNCSKCGAQNIDGVTFCGSCGAQMESHIPQAPEAPKQNFQNVASNQPPPYQQQAYNAPNATYSAFAGNPSNGGMVPPKNYMVESIIVTVLSFTCCCSPISAILGIIAIIKANNVNTEFERGNINEAISNSESAKKLALWAAIITIIFVIISWVSYFLFWGAILAAEGGWDAILNR